MKSSRSGVASNDLTVGSEARHLVRLTGFMVLGLVAVMSANLIETIYVGLLGTQELAALGFTFPLVMLMQSMTMGLAIGASSVVARRVGSSDVQSAKLIITHSLLLTTAFVVLVIMLVRPNLLWIFAVLGADQNAKVAAVEYMQVWFYGLPVFAIAMVGSSLMRAVGDVATPGYLMAIGAFMQVLFGPIFIFGVFGWPGLGLEGAAVAFVVARCIGFVFYLYCMLRDKMLIFSLDGFCQSTKEVFHVGLPAIASNLIGPVSMTVITRLVAGYGTAVVAGFSLATRIETMFAMVIWALSMSVAPFIGQNWGAGKFARVWRAVTLAHVFALCWGAFAFLMLLWVAPLAISQVTEDAQVAQAATIYLLIVPIGMGLMGITANAGSSFNALGQPGPPLVMSVLQMIVLTIPLAVLGNAWFGFAGIFGGGLLAVVISAAVMFFWLRRNLRAGAVRPAIAKSLEAP